MTHHLTVQGTIGNVSSSLSSNMFRNIMYTCIFLHPKAHNTFVTKARQSSGTLFLAFMLVAF